MTLMQGYLLSWVALFIVLNWEDGLRLQDLIVMLLSVLALPAAYPLGLAIRAVQKVRDWTQHRMAVHHQAQMPTIDVRRF